jgi:hypothetical protein
MVPEEIGIRISLSRWVNRYCRVTVLHDGLVSGGYDSSIPAYRDCSGLFVRRFAPDGVAQLLRQAVLLWLVDFDLLL